LPQLFIVLPGAFFAPQKTGLSGGSAPAAPWPLRAPSIPCALRQHPVGVKTIQAWSLAAQNSGSNCRKSTKKLKKSKKTLAAKRKFYYIAGIKAFARLHV
jgi:hypothetical protein